ncbi:hypothetical protein B0A48_04831 [Cryoendolithus antarcticus]|uniref:Uncharacterized protein n=1 Tax=Cryoendolithus antarcticus TaxID=1507870 RepID=A0A1V8TDI5_9PEZI|nr:hypothetical protein B0A48_04831 [Cryoendolithus antarcticus]
MADQSPPNLDVPGFDLNELSRSNDGEDGIRVPLRLEWLNGGQLPVLFAVLPRALLAQYGVPGPAIPGVPPIYINELHPRISPNNSTSRFNSEQLSRQPVISSGSGIDTNVRAEPSSVGSLRNTPASGNQEGPVIGPLAPLSSISVNYARTLIGHEHQPPSPGRSAGSKEAQASSSSPAVPSAAKTMRPPPVSPKPTQGRKHRPSDASSSHRKSKRSVARLNRANPKERVEAAKQKVTKPFDVIIIRDLDVAAALQIITPIIPLHLQTDDFSQAKREHRDWISKILSAFNSPLAAMPESWPRELRVEWDKWEKDFDEHVLVTVAEAPSPDYMQARATDLFWKVIAAHDTSADPNAGIRHGGSRLGKSMRLSCTARLTETVGAMKSLAIVRSDVIRGDDLPFLIANPKGYAKAKISNKLTNETKKEKYKDLHQRMIAENVRARAEAREKKRKLKQAATLPANGYTAEESNATGDSAPDVAGEHTSASGSDSEEAADHSDGESYVGSDWQRFQAMYGDDSLAEGKELSD